MYSDYDQEYNYQSYPEFEPHSGDPILDLEYERQSYSTVKVPEVVEKFLLYFRNAINEGLVNEIQNLYENDFPRLTEKFFESQPWPNEDELTHIFEDDVFYILYKELYYRHIYAHLISGPNREDRINSFSNYCNLFNYILSSEEPVPLELPDIWLWELIDEFIYQYQNFTQYRARLNKLSDEDLEVLSSNNKVWNVLCVLNVLHSLVEKSNIKLQLQVSANGGDPESVSGKFGHHSLYKMLGFYSLIGLLRLHSLLGDYYEAINVLKNIELHKKSQYLSVPACQITTSYYVGFAYMMMRRYSDAIRTFCSILLFIQRTKQLFTTRSYQNDQINKQTEQMYHLLAICLVLHPQYIDESIQQFLREKMYHEKMYKMHNGDLKEFETCFLIACPKFLSPYPPTMDLPREDYTKEATRHQCRVFMDEVQQQLVLPTIRSYLKLYTTLPLSKLAAFMYQAQKISGDNYDKIQQLIAHLLCFKHKMKNVVWTKGTNLEGKFHSGSELDFYIDNDMIHIADTKVSSRYGDFFIRKILKFQDMNNRLQAIKM